jgi:hypothetical protein
MVTGLNPDGEHWLYGYERLDLSRQGCRKNPFPRKSPMMMAGTLRITVRTVAKASQLGGGVEDVSVDVVMVDSSSG